MIRVQTEQRSGPARSVREASGFGKENGRPSFIDPHRELRRMPGLADAACLWYFP